MMRGVRCVHTENRTRMAINTPARRRYIQFFFFLPSQREKGAFFAPCQRQFLCKEKKKSIFKYLHKVISEYLPSLNERSLFVDESPKKNGKLFNKRYRRRTSLIVRYRRLIPARIFSQDIVKMIAS